MNEWKMTTDTEIIIIIIIAALWTGTRPQRTHLGSFVDFVFVAPLVNKHGRGLSILESRRVHGESGGQRHERLPQQSAAPQRAALRAHGPASSCSTVHTETDVSTTACRSKRTHKHLLQSEADKPEWPHQPLDVCGVSSWCRLANFVTTLASLSIAHSPPNRHATRSLALV